MSFGCFHSRDSQLDSKCSFCSIKIIFIDETPPFVLHVWLRNPPETAVTTTPKNIPNQNHNIDRNMASVLNNQSSRCFSNIYSIIYQPGQLLSRSERNNGRICLLRTNHSESHQLTTDAMLSLTLIFQNKSLKLCLVTLDTLGRQQKKESG